MKEITFGRIQRLYERNYGKLLLYLYRLSIPSKVKSIRKKDKIKVLFVVNELPTWKTETLYNAMLSHSRFEPIIGVTLSLDMPESKSPLVHYLNQKKYDFIDLDMVTYNPIKDIIKPDIIFYEKPYMDCYHQRHTMHQHLDSLFCYASYGVHTLNLAFTIDDGTLMKNCWQLYFESQFVIDSCIPYKVTNGKNFVATGLPMFDSLQLPLSEYKNPWMQDSRKRIIFAPHHSIGTVYGSGIGYGTFLEFGESVLKLAKKYNKETQWAFKPHPGLRRKLDYIWGKEKTDTYYNEWATLENGQIYEGDYQSLFMHSDAMIHDCSSFQVEYHFTKNPVLYLQKGDKEDSENRNSFGLKALNLHYKAKTVETIETFINDVVIGGNDTLKSEREIFYSQYLVSPQNKTACENILDAILGK